MCCFMDRAGILVWPPLLFFNPYMTVLTNCSYFKVSPVHSSLAMTLSKGLPWIPVVRKKVKNFCSFVNFLTLFFFMWSNFLAYMFLFLFRELSTVYKIQSIVTHSVNFKVFSFFSGCIISIIFMLIVCSCSSPLLSTYNDGFIELVVYPSS
jgi:hypothetical protein